MSNEETNQNTTKGAQRPTHERLVIRAFSSEWNGVKGIVFNTTASKARYVTYLSAKEAGYEPRLPDIKVKRAPEYDNHTDPMHKKVATNKCYCPEFLRV